MNFNSRITKYFLNNTRFTLLLLVSLIAFGIGSILVLKTTGFPSPEIKVAIVNTIYPGASSGTVLEQVTKPIEAAIKSIDGVESYNSTSSNNVSTIAITIAESANSDSVKSKLDSVISSIQLPTGAEKPNVISPKIGGDDYYYALTSTDQGITNEQFFNALQILKNDVEKNPSVNSFNIGNNLQKKVVIALDQQKLQKDFVTQDDIVNQLKLWGFDIPVIQNAQIGEKLTNISLTISGQSLDDLKNIQITSSLNPRLSFKLSDLADVSYQYLTDNNIQSYAAYKDGASQMVAKASLFTIDISKDANLASYDTELQSIVAKYFDQTSGDYKSLDQATKDIFSKFKLLKIYSVADSNKSQVNEVVSGLVGSKWDNPLGYIGLVFGGIELVFLAMLVLVSWRAALVSALAIPLSFFFSTIIIKLTGNDLNTLILFSLVLVIGLVVDPALVVLESIQRNLDNGRKGKDAVLNAIKEIGTGLFLAVLTSILVFVPFGVVSGFFGAIISYIPLTILPALVGSYVVPLVFLAWFGGLILRPKRHLRAKIEEQSLNGSLDHAKQEKENLWRAARGVIKINEWILNSKWYVRFIIILAAVLIPVLVAGYFISSRQVRFVQFGQPSDSERIDIDMTNFPQLTPQIQQDNQKAVEIEVIKNENVDYVAEFGTNTLIVGLKPKEQRSLKAQAIANDINSSLAKLKPNFFDITATPEGFGVPTSNFPVAIAIKTNDLAVEKKVALDLTNILNKICKISDTEFKVNSNCPIGNAVIEKVNNGYNTQQTKFIQVKLNRDKFGTNPVNPLMLKDLIANSFDSTGTTKIATFRENSEDFDVVLANTDANGVITIDDIKNIPVRTLLGRTIKLSDIADINEVESLSSINRVKGETVGVVSAKPSEDLTDQNSIVLIQNAVIDEFNNNYKQNYPGDLSVETYSEGSSASISKSFGELGLAFLLAIVLTYIVLVIFFNSLLQPLVILFSIPLTFLGIFPAIAAFGNGQLGFLEIIGIIILVGLVENVGIFLIDAANQKIKEGWDAKKAIAYASGVRFRPILLTKVTTLVSTAPLAIGSVFYRSMSVVIIFGLLTSGLVSLFISPILYVFFRNLSLKLRRRIHRA